MLIARPVLVAVCMAVATPILASPRGDEIFWAVGIVEAPRILKAVCEDRFPEYKEQNATAFAASPYVQVIGDDLVNKLEDGPQKIKLQQALPRMRDMQATGLRKLNTDVLERMCKGFPESLLKVLPAWP